MLQIGSSLDVITQTGKQIGIILNQNLLDLEEEPARCCRDCC